MPRGVHLVVCGALLLVTGWVFQESLGHGFVPYDDDRYVTANRLLQQGGWAWMWRPYEHNWIPLTWLSLSLDHRLAGLDPFAYHLTNLVLHGAATLGFYGIFVAMMVMN